MTRVKELTDKQLKKFINKGGRYFAASNFNKVLSGAVKKQGKPIDTNR